MTTETQINTQPSRFEAEKALRFSGFGADLRLTLDIYMNRTLFSCGLRKSVELKDGRLYDITTTLEKEVNLVGIKCKHCDRSFKGQQYLDGHVQFKHPNIAEQNSNSNSSESTSTSTIVVNNNTPILAESPNRENVPRESACAAQGKVQSRSNNRKGSNTRKSYTVEFKKKTLDLLDLLKSSTKKYNIVAKQQGVNRSLVFKWDKNRSKILTELSLNKKKQNTGGSRSMRQRRRITANKSARADKYPLAANLLVAEFKLRRAAGSKVTKLWLKKKMKEKIGACYGTEQAAKFKGSSNWFQRFKGRHNSVLRRRTNKKKVCADDGRDTILKFHWGLRKSLKTKRRRNKSSEVDPKYGRWTPKNRYNVDQVPLPFVNERGTTYDTLGAKQVWVSQPSSGLDKRQATLQLCIRADGEQNVKPALIFRGKGHVATAEKGKYDKRVDVYFQQIAWMDKEINMHWVQGTLIPGIGKGSDEKVLFADNVGFQQSKEFHEKCRDELNTVVYMLPENHTDKLQPIDAGCGRMMKLKIGAAMETWLEEKDNLDKWQDKLSARERRILMTQWTGEAWSELCSNQTFFKRLFEKTGCLITSDGSDDFKISPQGLEDYVSDLNGSVN